RGARANPTIQAFHVGFPSSLRLRNRWRGLSLLPLLPLAQDKLDHDLPGYRESSKGDRFRVAASNPVLGLEQSVGGNDPKDKCQPERPRLQPSSGLICPSHATGIFLHRLKMLLQ